MNGDGPGFVELDAEDLERIEKYLTEYGLLVSEFGRLAGLRRPKYLNTIIRRIVDNGSTRVEIDLAARIETQLRLTPRR